MQARIANEAHAIFGNSIERRTKLPHAHARANGGLSRLFWSVRGVYAKWLFGTAQMDPSTLELEFYDYSTPAGRLVKLPDCARIIDHSYTEFGTVI